MNSPVGCPGTMGRDMGDMEGLPSIGASLGDPKPVEGVGAKIFQDKFRYGGGSITQLQ